MENSLELRAARGLFFADMLNFYGQDISRRSTRITKIDGSSSINCYYRHPENNNKCQIGRYIPDNRYQKELEGSIEKVLHLLPASILNLGEGFLTDLQGFHDNKELWEDVEGGLSCLGIERKHNVINGHNLIMPSMLNGRYIVETTSETPMYIEDFIKAMEVLQYQEV